MKKTLLKQILISLSISALVVIVDYFIFNPGKYNDCAGFEESCLYFQAHPSFPAGYGTLFIRIFFLQLIAYNSFLVLFNLVKSYFRQFSKKECRMNVKRYATLLILIISVIVVLGVVESFLKYRYCFGIGCPFFIDLFQ